MSNRTRITADEWRDAAIAATPEQLHDGVIAFHGAIQQMTDRHGEPLLPARSVIPLIGLYAPSDDAVDREDSALRAMNTLVQSGWIVKSDGVFMPAISTPIGAKPRTPGIKPRRRNNISEKIRYHVFMRDKFTCWLCGQECLIPNDPDDWGWDWDPVIDHVTPHAHGGSDGHDNLRTAHRWCNSVRGNRPAPDIDIMKARMIVRKASQDAAWMCLEEDPWAPNQGFDFMSAHELRRYCARRDYLRSVSPRHRHAYQLG